MDADRHRVLHDLAMSGAADAALRGKGLEQDAEILALISAENAKRSPNVDVLRHLYYARGMVNSYMERPKIAAESFGEVAARRTGLPRFRAVVNQIIALAQAGEKPGKELLEGLPLDGKSLEERYLAGLVHHATENIEKAIDIWGSLLKEAKPPPKPEAGTVKRRLLELDIQLQARIIAENDEPRPDETVLSYLHFARSSVNRKLGRNAEAEAELKQVKDRPAVESRVNAMELRARTGDQMAREEDPESVQYLIGPAYLQMDDPEAAIWETKLALAGIRPVPIGSTSIIKAVAEALVSALVAQERVDEAEKVWKKHLALEGEAEA